MILNFEKDAKSDFEKSLMRNKILNKSVIMQERKAGRLTQLSKFLAKVLRHNPEAAGVTLDEEGWCSVDELIKGTKKQRNRFTKENLEEIVATDEKGRYAFNEDHTKIRANQGHSVHVDLKLEPKEPPAVLYHGTATRFLDSIMKDGLKPMSRLQVHLSTTYETAVNVGKRHGKVVVLDVDSAKMHEDGIEFFCSDNGVWLTNFVDPKYLKVHEQ